MAKFWTKQRGTKGRWRATAVQDAGAKFYPSSQRESVRERADPLALSDFPRWRRCALRASFSRVNTAGSIKPRGGLVIGYGNTLRGDDGVGVRVAEAVEAWELPDVEVIACHQLMPELAEAVARAHRVVFVDAAVDAPRDVQWRRLEPATSSQLMAHAADPRTLLAMARDVYQHCPEAWWLTIPIEMIEFAESMSPFAQQGYAKALEHLRAWVTAPAP